MTLFPRKESLYLQGPDKTAESRVSIIADWHDEYGNG